MWEITDLVSWVMGTGEVVCGSRWRLRASDVIEAANLRVADFVQAALEVLGGFLHVKNVFLSLESAER